MKKLAISAAALVVAASAVSAEPSSFQRTCKDIGLDVTDARVMVQANCENANGHFIGMTQVELMGVHNMPAGLELGDGSSSYQRSCTDSKLSWDNNSVTLTATCQDGKGGTRIGTIAVENIHNINGQMTIR